jgi:hypothetical protein
MKLPYTRRNYFFYFVFAGISACLLMCCIPKARYYVNRTLYHHLEVDTSTVPERNKAILRYAATQGPSIAPTYQSSVCTEYIITILSHFTKLSTDQKSKIRIITQQDIESLLKSNSPIPQGVAYALSSTGAGTIVKKEEVLAGDFVQFWNTYRGQTTGHCGIVRALDLKKGLISLYSSSPSTKGHGEQLYVMPDYVFFVRMK